MNLFDFIRSLFTSKKSQEPKGSISNSKKARRMSTAGSKSTSSYPTVNNNDATAIDDIMNPLNPFSPVTIWRDDEPDTHQHHDSTPSMNDNSSTWESNNASFDDSNSFTHDSSSYSSDSNSYSSDSSSYSSDSSSYSSDSGGGGFGD